MFPSNYPLLQQSQPQLTAVNQGRFLGRTPSSSHHCQQQRQLQSLLHKSTTTTSSMRAPSTATRSVKAVMPMNMKMNMNAMTRRSMGHAAHTHGPSRRNIGAAVGLGCSMVWYLWYWYCMVGVWWLVPYQSMLLSTYSPITKTSCILMLPHHVICMERTSAQDPMRQSGLRFYSYRLWRNRNDVNVANVKSNTAHCDTHIQTSWAFSFMGDLIFKLT